MTDLISSDWQELDANNTNPSPNGVQGGYSPSQVAPIMRSIRGALKRFYNQTNALLTSTGTANAYVLTYGQAPSPGYSKGIVYRFYAHADSSGPATLNINSLGPKAILSQSGAALTAGQIKTGRIIELAFNGTSFEIISNESHDAKFTGTTTFADIVATNLSGNVSGIFTGNGALLTSLSANAVTTGTISDARLPTTQTGKTFTTTVNAKDAGGGVLLVPGTANTAGYVDFVDASSTRRGYIGLGSNSVLNIFASTGVKYDFVGSSEPSINSNKIWHEGNDGTASGLAADMTDGYHASETSVVSTLVARNSSGNIFARDGMFARGANDGYIYFGTNASHNIGSDGTEIRTSGLPFRVNGAATVTGSMVVGNQIVSAGSSVVTQSISTSGNAHYWYRSVGGVDRGLTYYSPTTEAWFVQLYNTAGAVVRSLSFRQSDGLFSVQGGGNFDANVRVGGSVYQTDGNVLFSGGMVTSQGASLNDALNARVKNDGGLYSINITGSANVLRQNGVSTNPTMTFNWTGLGGQPNWLWGGNDGTNHYVYNPSNFSVAQANNATNLAGLDSNQWARIGYSTNNLETAYPMGTYLPAYGGNVPRSHDRFLRYDAGGTGFTSNGVGTAIAGTWRCRGYLSSEGGTTCLYQRVG